MNFVRPKKSLGQHFLTDQNIARKIVDSLEPGFPDVLEIGPGMGVLTKFLLERKDIKLHLIEIDHESVNFLQQKFPHVNNIWHEDFLKTNLQQKFGSNFSIIGNFPYNISSQIFFKILENRNQVHQVTGMVQKEVAERITARHGSKTYGILSVLLQVFYNTEYLFTVSKHVFNPQPKVVSAVIRLKRNHIKNLPCDENLFVKIVKSAFGLRRKMLRNSLRDYCSFLPEEYAEKRPEQLSVGDFVSLTCFIENQQKK